MDVVPPREETTPSRAELEEQQDLAGTSLWVICTKRAKVIRRVATTRSPEGLVRSNTLVGDIAYVYAGASVQGGNDRLVSAANTPDDMWGDFQNIAGGTVAGGHDTFVFRSNNGNDIIHDFHQGEDIIELGTAY